MDLLQLFNYVIVADRIFSFLSDDDLRFLYGTCRIFRDACFNELRKKGGSLVYTKAQLYISPQALKLSPKILYNHEVGRVSLEAQCAYGHVVTYKYICESLSKYCKPSDSLAQKITIAAEKGYFEMLKHTFDLDSIHSVNIPHLVVNICKQGRLDIAKWLCEKCNISLHKVGLEPTELCANHHTDIMLWLYDKMPHLFTKKRKAKLLALACANNNIMIRNLMHELDTKNEVHTFLSEITTTGHLCAVIWWYETFGIKVEDILSQDNFIANICRKGHIQLAQWLYKTFDLIDHFTKNVLDYACMGGHLHVMQWLVSVTNPDIYTLKQECYMSYNYGHMSLTQWLCEKSKLTALNYTSFHNMAMTNNLYKYADFGVTQISYWFHQHFTLKLRPEAGMILLTKAITNGELHIIQWIWHACKSHHDFMDKVLTNAAKYGHLHVVRWAYETEHFTRPFTGTIFCIACRGWHLHIMEYLNTQFNLLTKANHKNILTLLSMSCSKGDLKTARWLHTKFKFTTEDIRANNYLIHRTSCIHSHIIRWLNMEFLMPEEYICPKWFPKWSININIWNDAIFSEITWV